MWYLFEALGYSFLILLKVAFWPVIIIGGIALVANLIGKAVRASKKSKK